MTTTVRIANRLGVPTAGAAPASQRPRRRWRVGAAGLLAASGVLWWSSPAVAATDVNVVNNAKVTVVNRANNAAFVRDAQNPAFQPFQAEVVMVIPEGAGAQQNIIPAAPEGKRLVIEHVTVDALVPAGQRVLARIKAGSDVEHALVVTSQGFGHWVTSQPIRLYTLGGGLGSGFAIVERSASDGQVTAVFTVSGHLVDLP